MRPRVSIVSASLLVLSCLHALWGLRVLAASETFLAGSQLVGAGGLLLASVGADSRRTFATGIGIAALATSVRAFAHLASPGPFLGATVALALGMSLAAWGARMLDTSPGARSAPLLLRGGLLVWAVAYATFAALGVALSDRAGIDTLDLALRAGAALACALYVDAPAIAFPERKRFAGERPMRAR